MSKKRVLGALLIAGAVFAAACGSSSESFSPDGVGGGSGLDGVGAAAHAGSGNTGGRSVGAGSTGSSGAAAEGSIAGAPDESLAGATSGGADNQPGGGNAGSAAANSAGNGNGSGGGATASCKAYDESCRGGTECCSGVCNAKTNTCASVLASCAESGESCASATDCCNLRCENHKCGALACVSDGGQCTSGGQCCGGTCNAGKCAPLNTACKTSGNACSAGSECCSKTCTQGKCELSVSYCIQPGDVCARDQDCCSGGCTIASGSQLGTCNTPPTGASFCSGVDGVVCNGCGDCCSRLCEPFGPSGVKICQPASGCHVTGDLCRKNSDCCGGTLDSTLPGYGNVTCEIDPGKSVGICRTPVNGPGDGGACNPQGNVCHMKDYACSISSARADCCGGLGAKGGVCELDQLGVPRCNGLGSSCRQGGETCASAADCCNDVPCVPDALGALRCIVGSTCAKAGSSCTINGDCCTGTLCLLAPGSTVGTCGNSGGGGSGGSSAGGSSGTSNGGSSAASGSGGTPSAGGTNSAGGSGGMTSCGEYGQQCQQAADCCNSVPCDGGLCRFPAG